jgi:tricorn protease
VDKRFNSGGQAAEHYVDLLRRPFTGEWAQRYGDDMKPPMASTQGPKITLTNENAGSGGDPLPWFFRKLLVQRVHAANRQWQPAGVGHDHARQRHASGLREL